MTLTLRIIVFMLIASQTLFLGFSGKLAANPLSVVTAAYKTYQKREIDDALKEIQKDLDEIKTSIMTLKDSQLKAALSALNDARKIKSQEEKLNTIRSAKSFLMQAIHLEKDPEKKALAYYTLAHLYLLLNEAEIAKSHFERVLQIEHPFEEKGWWAKEVTYNHAVTVLKREASAALCALNYKGDIENVFRTKDSSENWCAIHLGYRDAKQMEVQPLDDCVRHGKKTSCELIGKKLLTHYLDQNELGTPGALRAKKSQPNLFESKHNEHVLIASSLLFETCDDDLVSKNDLFESCYWKSRALFQKKDYSSAMQNDLKLCEAWFRSSESDPFFFTDEKVASLGEYACTSLYKQPIWPITTPAMRFGIIQDLCVSGRLEACESLLSETALYDYRIEKMLSYLTAKCSYKLGEDYLEVCRIIEDNTSESGHFFAFKLNRLEIGLNKEGESWDVRDGNPDVLFEIKVNYSNSTNVVIYSGMLKIKEIRTKASGKPKSYIIDVDSVKSLYLDTRVFREPLITVSIYDVDTMSNDVIGEGVFKGFDEFSTFGSVVDFKMSVVKR